MRAGGGLHLDDDFDRGVLGEGVTMQDINSNNSPSPIPPSLTPRNLDRYLHSKGW